MAEQETQEKEKMNETKAAEPKAAAEPKPAEISSEKQKSAKPKRKFDSAVVNAKDVPISTKDSIAICRMIKKISIEKAISKLQDVVSGKEAVPMRGDEIPHRKGMMSGRYPSKASKQFIKLLKNLSANASVNGLDLDKTRIVIAKADTASRTRYHKKYRKFKRTHVTLIAKEFVRAQKLAD